MILQLLFEITVFLSSRDGLYFLPTVPIALTMATMLTRNLFYFLFAWNGCHVVDLDHCHLQFTRYAEQTFSFSRVKLVLVQGKYMAGVLGPLYPSHYI